MEFGLPEGKDFHAGCVQPGDAELTHTLHLSISLLGTELLIQNPHQFRKLPAPCLLGKVSTCGIGSGIRHRADVGSFLAPWK